MSKKEQQLKQILKLLNRLPEERRESELRAAIRRCKFKVIRNDNPLQRSVVPENKGDKL
jgi:hypothetical protein